MKSFLKSLVVIFAVVVVLSGATHAAFTATATISGNTFSVGNAALRLYIDLAGGATAGNLIQTKPNFTDFNNIYPNWTSSYDAKLYNSGTVALDTNVVSVPVTPHALASQINVEAMLWTDANADGVADPGELGASLGTKTLQAWESSPFSIGVLNAGQTQGVHFVFSVGDLDDTYQGVMTMYDFVFNGTSVAPTP